VLRDGQLQQVNSPQRLFTNPANLFVAGFIGSPAMNFAGARLIRDGGAAVAFAGCRIPVPPAALHARPELHEYFGREVIVGIRPCAFEDSTLADATWARIAVTAEVVEELGSDIHVIFTIDAPPIHNATITGTAADDDGDGVTALTGGNSLWTARVSPRSRVRPGHRLQLAIDTSSLHFFDPASGRAIGRSVVTAP
jgi:multiple sugar transport system ATP-binding protein